MLQYQFYWISTVRYCPSTSLLIWYSLPLPWIIPTDTLQSATIPIPDHALHYYPNTNPVDILQSTIVPIPVLLIRVSTLLPQVYPYLYATVHFAPVPVLLISHSPLLPQYPSYWYPTVHYCLITSPIDTALLPQYQSYLFRFDMSQSTAGQKSVLLIPDSPLLL